MTDLDLIRKAIVDPDAKKFSDEELQAILALEDNIVEGAIAYCFEMMGAWEENVKSASEGDVSFSREQDYVGLAKVWRKKADLKRPATPLYITYLDGR